MQPRDVRRRLDQLVDAVLEPDEGETEDDHALRVFWIHEGWPRLYVALQHACHRDQRHRMDMQVARGADLYATRRGQ